MKKIENLDDDKAKFVEEKCELALQRTLDDRESIQKKGLFILGVVSAIIAFGVGLLVNQWIVLPLFACVYLISLVTLLTALSISLVLKCLPSLYAGKGYDPDRITEGKFLTQELKNIRIGYASELQGRISGNRDRNDNDAKNLKETTLLALLSPFIALVLLLIFLWLTP